MYFDLLMRLSLHSCSFLVIAMFLHVPLRYMFTYMYICVCGVFGSGPLLHVRACSTHTIHPILTTVTEFQSPCRFGMHAACTTVANMYYTGT